MESYALVLFVLTYVLLLAFPTFRAGIALASAGLFVLSGILPANKVFAVIDWNVLLMIAGTMGVVAMFIESKMPALLADFVISKTPDVKWTIISLALFAGIISAFIDNVATVLMVAPVALTIARKLRISPVPSIIAIAISSNLQGAATLVGDTTSILLGGYANMDFIDFFLFQGKPGLFWVVQAGALSSIMVLLWVFRKEDQPIASRDRTRVYDYFPTALLVGLVGLLISASFIPDKPSITNGLICMSLLFVGAIRNALRKRNGRAILRVLREIDLFTILLLAGLFVVIGGITEAGIVQLISNLFVQVSGNNIFVIYTLLVWASVFLSAFIDNIPYVATMLPVTAEIATSLNIDPFILFFGLLAGATLGGNLTPIGASANISALGILRKNGYEVKAGEFMRLGIPFTLAAVTVGYVLIWVLWS